MKNINLNTDFAKEGSGNAFNRIEESGKYVGIFTQARIIKAGTGATGVEFMFKDKETEAEANYLTVWTINKEGGEIYGMKQLHAIMTVMKIKELNLEQTVLSIYDQVERKEKPTQCDVYPNLVNAPIGLLLQKEEYEKGDKSIGEKMNFFGFFNAESGQTAKELLEDKPAEQVDRMMKTLRDKTLTKRPESTSTTTSYPEQSADYDSSIPF